MINKERSPNIKGNALHEKNTSYNFVPDQGSSRFPFLILLRAEFNIYCVQCTLAVWNTWRKPSVWIWFVAFNGYLQKEMDRFKSFLYGIILHAVPLKCYFKYFVSMLIYFAISAVSVRPNVNNGLDSSQNKAVNLGG